MLCANVRHYGRVKCHGHAVDVFSKLNVDLRRFLATDRGKPHYITTPIFYPNSSPHIGHLHSLVTADIFARHARLQEPDRRVELVTGTDEHGLKIQKAAKDRGVTPKELCDDLSRSFLRLSEAANVSHTRFMRTTSSEHEHGVRHLWNELVQRGWIYKGTHSGWYSISDECFYTDSQISSRTDRVSGDTITYALETGNPVEWTEESNYKFALSRFRGRLLVHFSSSPHAIYPRHQYDQIIACLSSVDDPSCGDISVSRPSSRLTWGIEVPGDSSQIIYVWLDALTTYLTGIGYPWTDAMGNGLQNGWPADLQVIGKDILRFHAIYFPAFLLALDLPLPRSLLSHSHWTVEKAKMSKSVGNVVDPFEQMKTHGVDVVRWYLARVGGRFKDDVDWSTSELRKYKDELNSLVGNLFLRIQSQKILARLPASHQSVPLDRSILSEAQPGEQLVGNSFRSRLRRLNGTVSTHLTQHEVADAVQAIAECLTAANKEITTLQPWSPKTPVDTIISLQTWLREALRVCGILLQPFIPTKASELLDALRVAPTERAWEYAEVGSGSPDPGPMKRTVLFPAKQRETSGG